MKRLPMLLGLVLLAWPVAAQDQPAASADATAVATLAQATGQVMVRHAGAWARVEKTPVFLFSGDTISTDRGRAEVHFLRDDSTLVLDVGTQLNITESQQGGSLLRRVEIFLGDVWFKMQHSLQRKTDLATPTAVGGLRGTQGLIHVEDSSQSEFALSEGQLAISSREQTGASAEPTMLNPGQSLRALRGKTFEMRAAAAAVVKPSVSVAANKLPKPRGNWRNLVSKDTRPPAASKVRPVSNHAQLTGAVSSDKAKAKKTKIVVRHNATLPR